MSLTPLVSGPRSQAAGRRSLSPEAAWQGQPDLHGVHWPVLGVEAGPSGWAWLPGRGPAGTSVLLAEAEAYFTQTQGSISTSPRAHPFLACEAVPGFNVGPGLLPSDEFISEGPAPQCWGVLFPELACVRISCITRPAGPSPLCSIPATSHSTWS